VIAQDRRRGRSIPRKRKREKLVSAVRYRRPRGPLDLSRRYQGPAVQRPWTRLRRLSAARLVIQLSVRRARAHVRDTDPLQLIAHDILQFVLNQTELHHRVAGEYGTAEGEAGIIGASLPPASLALGLDLRALAGTTQLRQLGQFRVLLDVRGLVVGVAVAASPRDRVLRLGRAVVLARRVAFAVPPTWTTSGRAFLLAGRLRRFLVALGTLAGADCGTIQATLREPLLDLVLPTDVVPTAVVILVPRLFRFHLVDSHRPPRTEHGARHGRTCFRRVDAIVHRVR